MVGKTLSHYKILEELGRGGMGIVYKAELLFNLIVGNRLADHCDPGWIRLEGTLFGRQLQLANLTY